MQPTDYRFRQIGRRVDRLVPAQLELFAYPMGDLTVRAVPGSQSLLGDQVLWVTGTQVDWTVVTAWAQYVTTVSPTSRRILVLPYLPSARGDKDMPCPAHINGVMAGRTGITDLVTADPHSDVWLDSMRVAGPCVGVHIMPVAELVAESLRGAGPFAAIIAPDAGAVGRAGAVASRMGLPLVTASKRRAGETGRLTGYALDDLPDPQGRYLVVDDICDGGATFSLLAQAAPVAELELWVTHGGFTRGAATRAALRGYARVHTTDSLPSAGAFASTGAPVTVHPITDMVTRTVMRVAGRLEDGQ